MIGQHVILFLAWVAWCALHSGLVAIQSTGLVDRRGVLGLVRHPWYLACTMLVWARDLTLPELVVNVVVTCYFVLGAYWEEKKLVREFGQEYVYYQQEVSMLVPSKWLWRAAKRAASGQFRAGRGETCGHDEPEEDDHL